MLKNTRRLTTSRRLMLLLQHEGKMDKTLQKERMLHMLFPERRQKDAFEAEEPPCRRNMRTRRLAFALASGGPGERRHFGVAIGPSLPHIPKRRR